MTHGRQDPDDWYVEYDPTSEINNSWDRNHPTPETTTSADEPPVAVGVDDAGLVTSVSLATTWKQTVDPRELHTTVLNAVQNATMQVLVNKADQVDMTSSAPTIGSPTNSPDISPLSTGDVQRLLDDVYADVDRFTEQASVQLNQPVSITSSGGHVRGSARNGQIHDLSIDPNWSSRARNTEIESELNETLKKLSEQGTPGDLAKGPQSRAISELNDLVRDPQLFLRRLGLPKQP